MALVTGTPLGTITASEEVYVEGAPNIYFQNWTGVTAIPDADGFYWGMSGTVVNPVFQLGCYENVRLGENMTINSVRCDTVGDKSSIQKLNYLELQFNLKSMFPLSILSKVINGGAVTTNATSHMEKFGIGQPNNLAFYRFYLPKVYDESDGDFVMITLHKAQFVEAFELNFAYGAPWTIAVRVRAYANDTLPAAQLFATVMRQDPGVL